MHQGSCLCKSVRFEIDSDLRLIVHCHCKFCRKAHGAAFTTVHFMPIAKLRFVQGEDVVTRYHVKSLAADRCFCRQCGTRLFNHAPAAGIISLIVGTLDLSNIQLRPLAHVNTESKCSWFQINDDLPQFLATPSPAEFGKLLSK